MSDERELCERCDGCGEICETCGENQLVCMCDANDLDWVTCPVCGGEGTAD